MKYLYPDFYDEFKCKADRCRHSCCLGWEIDIDEDSLNYYNRLESPLGEEIRANISMTDTPHFVLTDSERCPFLQSDGLCRLICLGGDELLCDICREHPRFYNCYSHEEHAGLGLCCEEAARLLLEGEEPLTFTAYTDDEDGYCTENENDVEENRAETLLLSRFYELCRILSDRNETLKERIEKAAELCAMPEIRGDLAQWAKFFLDLERLDESWSVKLIHLSKAGVGLPVTSFVDAPRYERLLVYFLYRHFPSAGSVERAGLMLAFSVLSTGIIAALDACLGFDVEHTRLYSSEIEYSDENIDLILAKIAANGQ